ncbi:MAG: hypothetical protein U0174_18810 [Polyangiaceae bacterium]
MAGMKGHFRWFGLVSALGFFALGGCVAAPPAPPPRAMVVMTPPPAPVPEQPSPPPNPGARWLAGYWHWTGIEYAWIPGHWAVAPPNAIWSAPRYFNQGGQTFYEPGRWAPPK